MYALNLTQIIGHVTETPEVRELPSGAMVADINLEIKSTSNGNSGPAVTTTYLNVTVWRRMAEIARDYVQKGSQVFFSGRLETESWEDDQGNKKYKTKMVANDMILLSPKDGPLEPIPESLKIFGGINKAEIIGNITKDPELKTTPNGNMVTAFAVATNRQWKNQNTGEMQEKTEFHNIVVWDELAEQISKHLTKGRKVYVSGRIQTRSWDAPDGSKRYTTEIVATEVKSLGHAYHAGSASSSSSESMTAPAAAASVAATSEIPEVNYESDIKPEDLPF